MDNHSDIIEQRIARITCAVDQQIAAQASEQICALRQCDGSAQSGRTVRQFVRPRRWGLPGNATDTREFPMTVFRFSVPESQAIGVMQTLAGALDLHTPGRGSVFVQNATGFCLAPECGKEDNENMASMETSSPLRGVSRELTLITAVLSESGSGGRFSRMALELGVGVPLITLGSGTGIRNRLGLLRITIPPEKEIVYLAVPAHDAAGMMRLLIESSHIDRPGGGFVYQTPIQYGMTDSLIRIGRQQHAASIEQMIAALDEISGSTAWRKRHSLAGGRDKVILGILPHSEISFNCSDGMSAPLVNAAMEAGAGGVTLMRVSRLSLASGEDNAAREDGFICVRPPNTGKIVRAILDAAKEAGDTSCKVQVMDVSAAYSYQRTKS